jgi:hypothetical protein
MCPGQLATALRQQAAARARPSPPASAWPDLDLDRPARIAISASQLAWALRRGNPGEPVVAGPPCLPEKGVLAPLQAPGTAGPVGGRCLPTNLAKDRADAQRLVATRLLDRLHDPLGHFSRLQRIHPRAR